MYISGNFYIFLCLCILYVIIIPNLTIQNWKIINILEWAIPFSYQFYLKKLNMSSNISHQPKCSYPAIVLILSFHFNIILFIVLLNIPHTIIVKIFFFFLQSHFKIFQSVCHN